jgi:hypothetical protein
LQVAPIESGRECAEDRYDNGDHNDLCRHRTNSIWFIDASIAGSQVCGFDLDQLTPIAGRFRASRTSATILRRCSGAPISGLPEIGAPRSPSRLKPTWVMRPGMSAERVRRSGCHDRVTRSESSADHRVRDRAMHRPTPLRRLAMHQRPPSRQRRLSNVTRVSPRMTGPGFGKRRMLLAPT